METLFANLLTPLQISKGGLARTDDLVASIDSSIDLLMNTPKGTLVSDPDYGFIFTALRFEIFNENDGTVYNSADDDDPLYRKKISGMSTNLQTFAAEFNNDIKRYEPRLSEVTTVMTYIREERRILMIVRGVISETKAPYEHKMILKTWS